MKLYVTPYSPHPDDNNTPAQLDSIVTDQGAISHEQFDSMMAKGLEQAKAGQGMDIEDAFAEINKSIR